MLGRRATVHQIAIGRADGKAMLHVPCEPNGQERHLLASLAAPKMGLSTLDDVRRLDQFGYENVGFIKIDIEGTELDALEGAETTIRSNRPNLLIELLAGHYPRPLDQIAAICARFDYRASIMVGPESIPAAEALESLRGRLRTRNVLFTPAT